MNDDIPIGFVPQYAKTKNSEIWQISEFLFHLGAVLSGGLSSRDSGVSKPEVEAIHSPSLHAFPILPLESRYLFLYNSHQGDRNTRGYKTCPPYKFLQDNPFEISATGTCSQRRMVLDNNLHPQPKEGQGAGMTDVFISYSRRDKVFTQKLVDALQAANREVWADWASIPAASDWDAEIKEGIEKTNTVLFVLSPEWIKSNECRKEMDHAIKMGKRMVPILHIMPAEGQEVPPELAKLNWVYMRESDDLDKAFVTLQSAMDTDLDWIKVHTRIQVRALEWEKKNRSASFALRGEDLTEGEQFIASGAEKSPAPTHLQSEYVLASRRDATRRQRQTLGFVKI